MNNFYQKKQPVDVNTEIRRNMDDKQEAIKISSSGRDAVMIVCEFYKPDGGDAGVKNKIIEWRDWLYKNVYTMSDEKYKELNSPF